MLRSTSKTQTRREFTRTSAAVVVGAAAILAASVVLPWFRAGIGDVDAYRPTAVVPLLVGVLATAAAIALAAVLGCRRARGPQPPLAMAISALALVCCTALIGLLETTPVQPPRLGIPVTVERLTFDLHAGAGLWVAAAAATVALVTSAGLRPPSLTSEMAGGLAALWRVELLGAVLMVGIALALALLRYQPWLDGAVAGQSLDVEGWALPWLGPLSLMLVWALAVAAALVCFGRPRAGALLSAGSGWCVACLSGIALLIGSRLGELSAGRIDLEALGVPESVDVSAGLDVTNTAWIAFVLGWVAAGAAALVLWNVGPTRAQA